MSRGSDETLWAAAPCTKPSQSFIWDYEIAGENKYDRELRHEVAAAECADYPVLELCRQRDHTGAAGVIAGEVVVGP